MRNPRPRRRHTRRLLLLQLAVLGAWWLLLAPPLLGGGTSYISVSGHSMEPTYVTGDLVVVRQQGEYRSGDIVAFNNGAGVVIHRITGGDGDGGYELRGDNNAWFDPWHPTDADVVGRAVLRLPGASRWVLALTQPAALAALVVVVLAISTDRTKKQKKRTPTTRRSRAMNPIAAVRSLAAVPSRTRRTAGAAVLVGCAALTASALAWTDDLERTTFREEARYEQAADLSYTFRVEPGTLYPGGLVGPVDAASPAPPVVFARPARALDVAIDYRVDGASSVVGTYHVDAVVAAQSGWETTLPVAAAVPFEGEVHTEVTLDLATIVRTIEQIDTEVGTQSTSYTIDLRAAFDVDATVGERPVEAHLAPALQLAFNRSTWSVTGELQARDEQRLGTELTEAVRLGGAPVPLLRWLAVPALALLAAAAWLVLRALRPTAGVRAGAAFRRPGIAVIDLDQPPAGDEWAHPVSSAEGLRQIAERDGGLVLRHEGPEGTSFYVHHDSAVYRYHAEAASR